MNTKYKFTALLSAAAIICTALPVSAAEQEGHPQYSRREADGSVLNTLYPPEDKDSFSADLLGSGALTAKNYGEIGEMYERIARWENTTVDQCLVVSEKQFLTPTKPYEITRLRTSPYRVTFKEGTAPDWDAIFDKWLEVLRRNGYPESSLENLSYELLPKPASEEFSNIDFFRTTQDGWKQYSILDVLEEFPEIEKIEAKFSYFTNSRPNATGGYSITVAGNSDEMPEIPADDIKTMQYDETGKYWYIKLNSEEYSAYFEQMKQLAADGGQGLSLEYISTCMADDSEEASYELPDYETLFERTASLEEYCRRIARWENVLLKDCIALTEYDYDVPKPNRICCQLLTPAKPYNIRKECCSPFRYYTESGEPLDKDEVLAKWKQMLLDNGYRSEDPDKMFKEQIGGMTFEASEGGYLVTNAMDTYGYITLADCLKTFPQVTRIEAQYRYMTDDRVNAGGGYSFVFNSDHNPYTGSRDLTEADFPELPGAKLERIDDYPYPDIYVLELAENDYAAYFAAMPYMQSQNYFVKNLRLSGPTTELADTDPDTPLLLGYEEIYSRPEINVTEKADMNQDGTVDVSDAVLLARFAAEDKTVRIPQTALAGADLNGDGDVTPLDVTAILRYIAKL